MLFCVWFSLGWCLGLSVVFHVVSLLLGCCLVRCVLYCFVCVVVFVLYAFLFVWLLSSVVVGLACVSFVVRVCCCSCVLFLCVFVYLVLWFGCTLLLGVSFRSLFVVLFYLCSCFWFVCVVVVVIVVVVFGCCWYGLSWRTSKNTSNSSLVVVVGLVCLSFDVYYLYCFCHVYSWGLCLGLFCLVMSLCCLGVVLFLFCVLFCLRCGVRFVCVVVASMVVVIGCCWYGLLYRNNENTTINQCGYCCWYGLLVLCFFACLLLFFSWVLCLGCFLRCWDVALVVVFRVVLFVLWCLFCLCCFCCFCCVVLFCSCCGV